MQPIGGEAGTATVINEAGVVAGHYEIAVEGPVHLFRYENGVATDRGTSAAGGFPVPLGINAAGTIVGELALPAGSAGESLAFRVRGGSSALEALPDLGGRQSTAVGVNDLEQVVGSSTLPGAPDTWRATLLSAGTLYDLDDAVVAAQGVTLNFASTSTASARCSRWPATRRAELSCVSSGRLSKRVDHGAPVSTRIAHSVVRHFGAIGIRIADPDGGAEDARVTERFPRLHAVLADRPAGDCQANLVFGTCS